MGEMIKKVLQKKYIKKGVWNLLSSQQLILAAMMCSVGSHPSFTNEVA